MTLPQEISSQVLMWPFLPSRAPPPVPFYSHSSRGFPPPGFHLSSFSPHSPVCGLLTVTFIKHQSKQPGVLLRHSQCLPASDTQVQPPSTTVKAFHDSAHSGTETSVPRFLLSQPQCLSLIPSLNQH